MQQTRWPFFTVVALLAVGPALAQGRGATRLPLHEVPAVGPQSRRLAFFISGDGGWAPIDREIAAGLADSGIAVLGLDARAYLGTRRTPDAVAADLAVPIREYLDRWHMDRLVLVGYSRGAVVVPFVATRLPADLKAKLDLVAMLGLGYHAGFHVSLFDLLHTTTNPKDPAVRPELEALGRGGVALMCVFGEDEKESLCRDGTDLPMRRVGRTGAHHFDGDRRALAGEILASLRPGVAGP
jgi:type IV secretory pathway VirJ component